MTIECAENNNTALKIISLIFQGYFSRDEIISQLGISATGFYKGLFELRDAGFRVTSSKTTYHIKNINSELTLSEYERSILAYMINLSWLLLPNVKTSSFKNFIRRMMFHCEDDDYNDILERFAKLRKIALTKEFQDKLEKLRDCLIKDMVVKLILNSGRELYIEPSRLDWERDGLYLCFYNKRGSKDKEESVSVDRIAKIVLEDEEEYFGGSNEVIYEIYGKLAKSYLLKMDERVVDSTKYSLVIGSGNPDHDALFKRLLRYDTLCKVLQPKSAVKEFYALIEQSLANLKASPDPDPNLDGFTGE